MKTKQRRIRERRERAWRASWKVNRGVELTVADLCAALKLLEDAADGFWMDRTTLRFPAVIVRAPHA